MAHDSLSQHEILDCSDIAQLLPVNKSKTHKDSKCIAKAHTQYVFARSNKAAIQLIDRGTDGGLARSDMCVHQETNIPQDTCCWH